MLRSLSIRVQLRILLMLLALPSIALIGIWAWNDYQHLVARERLAAVKLVQTARHQQQVMIEDSRQFLKHLAQHPVLQSPDKRACDLLLARQIQLSPSYRGIGVFDPALSRRCSASDFRDDDLIGDDLLLRQTMDLMRFSSGGYQLVAGENEANLTVAYPLLPTQDNRSSGSVAVALSLDWWHDLVAQAELPGRAYVYLLDRQNNVMASHPEDITVLGTDVAGIDPILGNLRVNEAPTLESQDGLLRVFTAQVLMQDSQGHAVRMVLGMPVEAARSEVVQQLFNRLGIFTLGLIIIWAGVMTLLDHQVLQPLRGLRLALDKLETGRLEDEGLELQSNRVAEFRKIVQSFRRMSFARLSAETAEIAKRRQLEALLDALPDVYFRLDHRGYVLDYKAQTDADLFLQTSDFLGKRLVELLPLDVARKFEESLHQLMQKGQPQTFEYQIGVKDGMRDFEVRLGRVGVTGEVVVVTRNITFQRAARESLLRQARVDFLTNLPNRSALNLQLETALRDAGRNANHIALLFVDLDGLKPINDRMGHALGDELIKRAAQRLRDSVETKDFVARHAGDEFIILLTEDDPVQRAAEVAEAIIERMQRPFDIDFETLRIGASVGIAQFPDHAQNAGTLLTAADQAMYAAKALGGGQHVHYTPEIGHRTRDRLRMHDDLVKALKEDHFELVYQPIIDLKTGRIAQAEALLRLNHPQLGMLSPDAFLATAEDLGMGVEIGDLVLRKACADLYPLRDSFGAGFTISINHSPVELAARASGEGLDWPRYIRENTPDDAGVSVEITEGALLDSSDQTQDTLAALRASGIKVALDDFGAGHSSLTYFLENEFDILKLDKAFVRGLPDSPRAAGLCQAILNLAQHLGNEVVVEGVETAGQLAFFRARNCAYAQGYYFSKALPLAEFLDLPDHFDLD